MPGPAGGLLSATARRELALLARHDVTRAALAATALVAFVSTYGRVPAIACGALVAGIAPLGNALGPDLAMGGVTRHHLLPLGAAVVRDRRLAAWSGAAAVAVLAGTALALALPAPSDVGRPAGGVLAAPALALYMVAVLPHAGRAGWWFAAHYAQPARTRRAVGTPGVGARAEDAGRGASFSAAVALLAVWTAVGLTAAALLAAATAAAGTLPSVGQGAVWYAGIAIATTAAVALFAGTRARA